MTVAADVETIARPEALLRVPVGLSSPLWGLFAGAAMTGAAWWWMTRWARPENLEALFGAAEATTQAAVAPAIEPGIAPEPATATMAAAPVESASEPVGGEAAPVSPLLEAVAGEPALEREAPKPKPAASKPA